MTFRDGWIGIEENWEVLLELPNDEHDIGNMHEANQMKNVFFVRCTFVAPFARIGNCDARRELCRIHRRITYPRI